MHSVFHPSAAPPAAITKRKPATARARAKHPHTLPAPFAAVAERIARFDGGQTAHKLLCSALRGSTKYAYARHWWSFAQWCARNGCEALPASTEVVLAYIGSLYETKTIKAPSLQPYLTAINAAHADEGFPRPAVGHLIRRARQGFARLNTATSPRDSRIPLPAEAVKKVLRFGLRTSNLHQLRACYALVLTWLFLGRQDSAVSLRPQDHGINDKHIWLRVEEKTTRLSGVRRVIQLPLTQTHGHPPSLLPEIARLGARYTTARNMREPGARRQAYFQLPNENPPTTSDMSTWVREALAWVNVVPPKGFAYLGHSLRSGGASAAAAIGVPAFRANWLGGWAPSSNTREKHYVDPTVLPSTAAFQLLGWLLHASFTCA